MKYKNTLPRDVRELCAAHVRGYDRRLQEQAAARCGREQGAHGAQSQDAKSVQAVEAAMEVACVGIKNPGIRANLVRGLMLNIQNRKKYPYEKLKLPTIGRKEFYRRKNDFLIALAEELGYEGR